MATNRLIIVNKNTKDYLVIAKQFSYGWQLGNIELLNQFLYDQADFRDKTCLILGTENDEAFFKAYIKDGFNVNVNGSWEY